jgi:hypothetical protein
MPRTIYLATGLLVLTVMLVALRTGSAPLASADALGETATIEEQQPKSTKSDKLLVFSSTEPAAVKTSIIKMEMPPSEVAHPEADRPVRIVSRHWHDPLAPKTASTNLARIKPRSSGR